MTGPTIRLPHRSNASLRQVVVVVIFTEQQVGFGRWAAGRDLRVESGPGVAWPKSWRPGCEPAALATESFPVCPPGPLTLAATAGRRVSAWRRAKMASLIWRFRE